MKSARYKPRAGLRALAVGHVLLIFALLVSTGSHWVILQSIAWTTMLADNLQNTPFREAVAKTFDGRHPCCLCKQIAQEKKSEKKTDLSVDLKKLEFCYDSPAFVFAAPDQFWVMDPFEKSPPQFSQAPPTPPPRLV